MKCFTLLWAALAGTMRGSIAVADEFRIENGKIVVCSPFDLAVEIAYAVPRYDMRREAAIVGLSAVALSS